MSDAFDIFKIKHISLEHWRVHFRDIESDSTVRQEQLYVSKVFCKIITIRLVISIKNNPFI